LALPNTPAIAVLVAAQRLAEAHPVAEAQPVVEAQPVAAAEPLARAETDPAMAETYPTNPAALQRPAAAEMLPALVKAIGQAARLRREGAGTDPRDDR
jgi:hypothetical protein